MLVISRGVQTSRSFRFRLAIFALAAVALVAAFGQAPSAFAFDRPGPDARVVDAAGVLTDDELRHIERAALEVERAGAPVAVYLRLNYASSDQTIADARALMEEWDVQSVPDARDGVVIFFNLDPWDPEHGAFAIVAGEKHFKGGALPQRRLDWIRDDMTKPLKQGDIAGGIVLGLERVEEHLDDGPPSMQELVITMLVRGPLSLFNVIAVAASGLLYIIGVSVWSTRPRTGTGFLVKGVRPPSDLHPTYAGALVDADVTDAHVEAAVLELGRRGALAIEPVEGPGEQVQMRLSEEFSPRAPFEVELMDLLRRMTLRGYYGSKRAQHAESVILGTPAGEEPGVLNPTRVQLLRREWGAVKDAIARDLIDRGWFDPAYKNHRRPLLIAGGIAMLAAFAFFLFEPEDEPTWRFIGIGALFLTGVVVLGKGVKYPRTTVEGERVAMPWRGFKEGLLEGRTNPYGAIDLDDVFPYIAAFGVVHQFEAHFKSASKAGYVPLWMRQHDKDHRRYRTTDWTSYYSSMHQSMAPPSRSSSGSGGSSGGASSGSGGSGGRF
jgi:uncharacterized membrane protein YgcG